MKLSGNAIEDLKKCLTKNYGGVLVSSLSPEELNRIGVLVLTGLVESLKLEIAYPELSAGK